MSKKTPKRFYLSLLVLALLLGGCTPLGLEEELVAAMSEAVNGRYAEALQHTDLCLTMAPQNVDVLLLHGVCLYSSPAAGELSQASAIRFLEKATKLAPGRFDAWYLYGWMLYDHGMTHEAVEPLERALRLLPADGRYRSELFLMLGRCCLQNNLQAQALSYLQPLRVRKPYSQWAEIYNSLGLLALRSGKRQEALDNFSRAYQLAPGDASLLQNLGVVFDQHFRRPDLARHYYRKALEALPPSSSEQSRRLRLQARLQQLSAVKGQRR